MDDKIIQIIPATGAVVRFDRGRAFDHGPAYDVKAWGLTESGKVEPLILVYQCLEKASKFAYIISCEERVSGNISQTQGR